MDKLIQLDGSGVNGSTAVYAYDIAGNSWSTLGTARPDPAGTAPTSNSVKGAFDGVKGYVVLKDRKIYSHDPDADTWSAALATLPGTFSEWSMACDGILVGIVGLTAAQTVSLYLFDPVTNQIQTKTFTTSGIATLVDAVIAWDYTDLDTFYIVIGGAPSAGAAGKKYELWKYTISAQTFTQVGSTQTFSYSSTSHWARSLAFHTDRLYLLSKDGTFYSLSLADGTATTLSAFGADCAIGAGLFIASDVDLIAVGNSGSAVKRYSIAGDSWSAQAATPSSLGDWAAGYYTMPLSRQFEWEDAGGTALSGVTDEGSVPIGGTRILTLKLKALADRPGVIVTAPANTATVTYTVSTDGVTYASSVTVGDMATDATQTIYLKVSVDATAPPVTVTFIPRAV